MSEHTESQINAALEWAEKAVSVVGHGHHQVLANTVRDLRAKLASVEAERARVRAEVWWEAASQCEEWGFRSVATSFRDRAAALPKDLLK